jgi:hypothetical protein
MGLFFRKGKEKYVKKLVLVFMGLLSLAFFANGVLGQDGKGPRMTVVEREFDFKEVKEGAVLEHTFKILNKGNEPLKIISVKPG